MQYLTIFITTMLLHFKTLPTLGHSNQKSCQFYNMAVIKALTILPFSFLPEKIIDKLMIWLCWKKIIDKSLIWPWAMGNCKNFSWQLYCMAVTIIDKFLVWLCTSKFHWQLYCTASKIIDNLDIQLFAPLTIVLYGCQYQLTIVRDGHEPQSWQNYCKSLTKVL